jgi:hypothetical protein
MQLHSVEPGRAHRRAHRFERGVDEHTDAGDEGTEGIGGVHREGRGRECR